MRTLLKTKIQQRKRNEKTNNTFENEYNTVWSLQSIVKLGC